MYGEIFGPNVDPAKLSLRDLIKGLQEWERTKIDADPGKRTFGDMERQKDGPLKGRFKDDELVGILTSKFSTILSQNMQLIPLKARSRT
jgi:hypothetical protein